MSDVRSVVARRESNRYGPDNVTALHPLTIMVDVDAATNLKINSAGPIRSGVN
ncbi:MAG: hypothetical protein R3C20_17255 [Planctomycetaceae bacterium]